jgi:fumarate hydratase subunit beta
MTPLNDETILSLRAGRMVYLSGPVYTARDAAHKKLVELINAGLPSPFPFEGQAVFYAGPCPAPPGKIIGSVGPTTSSRMDAYSPLLIEHGLKIMIGKGERGEAVQQAVARFKGVYLTAVGGAAALTARCVKEARLIAFEELGAEAVRMLTVEKLPLYVAIDANGLLPE